LKIASTLLIAYLCTAGDISVTFYNRDGQNSYWHDVNFNKTKIL